MTLTHEDKALGLTLPSLHAFRIEDSTPSRSVLLTPTQVTHHSSQVTEGLCDISFRSEDEADRLNAHENVIWQALRPKKPGVVYRLAKAVADIASSAQMIFALILLPLLAMDFGASDLCLISIIGCVLSLIMLAFGIVLLSDSPNKCLTVTFEGIIPEDARAKMEAAKPDFDDILLVCDVANTWTPTKVRPPNPDPLIIGVKAIQGTRYYFLIGQFNLTRLEDHVGAEWTTSPEEA
jgi:hypothetical protein